MVTISTKWERLPAESTATMMESYPPDSGSFEMKSTLMASQRSSRIGRISAENEIRIESENKLEREMSSIIRKRRGMVHQE